MLHVSESQPIQNRLAVIEMFTDRMLGSGYTREQTRHCIKSGIKRYDKRRMSVKKDGSIYTSFQQMSYKSDIRKEVEKTTWFCSKEDRDPDNNFQPKWGIGGSKPPGPRRGLDAKQVLHQPISIMFYPRTMSGKLLVALRKVENSVQEAWPAKHRRFKIVEDGGSKIKNILIRDPWAKSPCPRPFCTACKGESPQLGSCSLREKSV